MPQSGLPEGIRVSGTGKVQATPDIARAHVGVQTFDPSVEVAVAENNRRMQAIMDALAAKGIAEKDRRTTLFQVSPRRDFRIEGPDNIVGFQVDNVLLATVRDLTQVGAVLQAAIDAGANNIAGVEFTLEDPTSARRDARLQAVADAQARAKTMAEAAGVTLGKPISIVEAGWQEPIGVWKGREDVAVAPIQPGEITVSVVVDVLYEIRG
jgi:uncharacterized protein YggE